MADNKDLSKIAGDLKAGGFKEVKSPKTQSEQVTRQELVEYYLENDQFNAWGKGSTKLDPDNIENYRPPIVEKAGLVRSTAVALANDEKHQQLQKNYYDTSDAYKASPNLTGGKEYQAQKAARAELNAHREEAYDKAGLSQSDRHLATRALNGAGEKTKDNIGREEFGKMKADLEFKKLERKGNSYNADNSQEASRPIAADIRPETGIKI